MSVPASQAPSFQLYLTIERVSVKSNPSLSQAGTLAIPRRAWRAESDERLAAASSAMLSRGSGEL